jgi:hypothetical protein
MSMDYRFEIMFQLALTRPRCCVGEHLIWESGWGVLGNDHAICFDHNEERHEANRLWQEEQARRDARSKSQDHPSILSRSA